MSTSLEILTPNEPSTALVAKLRVAGARLTDDDILAAVDHVEANRIAFGASAIVAGCYLLAKRSLIGHGQWTPYLEAIGGRIAAKTATRVRFAESKTVRSCRRYTSLAKHFLADLEQGRFRGEMRDELPAPPPVTPEEVLSLESINHERRIAVHGALETFVAGRSLRQMLHDLRRADDAADAEEREEQPKGLSIRARRALDEAPPPPVPLAGEQLELWNEMAIPLHQLDTFLRDEGPILHRTGRDFWTAVVDSLAMRLSQAKARLNNVR